MTWFLKSRNRDPVPVVQGVGWAPGPVWTGREILPPPGFDPRTLRSEASRYTDYATPAHTGPSENFIFRISPRPSLVPERVSVNKKDNPKTISSLHKKT
jgi:hypothetical protein